jgi:hypothetical protein
MFDLGRLARGTVPRSVRLTERGGQGLRGLFGSGVPLSP